MIYIILILSLIISYSYCEITKQYKKESYVLSTNDLNDVNHQDFICKDGRIYLYKFILFIF